jgi:hypothetical protein
MPVLYPCAAQNAGKRTTTTIDSRAKRQPYYGVSDLTVCINPKTRLVEGHDGLFGHFGIWSYPSL